MIGKILYGALFTVILPILAVFWARATEKHVPLIAPESTPAGAVLLGAGLILMGAGMRALWVRGGGVPMNAFPPPNQVIDGIYRWIRHPIYWGFSAACWGVSVITGSASGFWLVTPVLTLGWIALLQGYEKDDLERRFGPPHKVILDLPKIKVPAIVWYSLIAMLILSVQLAGAAPFFVSGLGLILIGLAMFAEKRAQIAAVITVLAGAIVTTI